MSDYSLETVSRTIQGPIEPYPLRPANELFDEQVRLTRSKIALAFRGDRITYSALEARATRLARLLSQEGARPQTFVGMYMKRSINAVVTLLAILKAGGAYVPLDPDYPSEWLKFIVNDASIPIIVTASEYKETMPAVDSKIIDIDHLQTESIDESLEWVPPSIPCDSPAYLSYTSGSTGVPKGVIYSHRHLTHRLSQASEDDVYGLIYSLSFSSSLTRLFPPLLRGSTLALFPEECFQDPQIAIDVIQSEAVTSIAFVPSALRQILDHARSAGLQLTSLRHVTVAGASLTADLVQSLGRVAPNAKLFYGYGSSETGPASLMEIDPGTPFDSRCIGRPLPNTRVFILDDSMRIVPPGSSGEMYISSGHLTLGYLNRPELTRERYLPSPWPSSPFGDRLFRTRDMVRLRQDCQLELLGRLDNQVKIRGHRVELEEVENVLARHSQVKEAAVTTEELMGETRLVAYVVIAESTSQQAPTPVDLRQFLDEVLPNYMIPAKLVIRSALPLTPNGKLDRVALRQLQSFTQQSQSPHPSEERLEDVLADIWAPLLGLDTIDVNAEFLDLGGDSVIATQIASRINETLGIDMPVPTIFEQSTIANLTSYITPLLSR